MQTSDPSLRYALSLFKNLMTLFVMQKALHLERKYVHLSEKYMLGVDHDRE